MSENVREVKGPGANRRAASGGVKAEKPGKTLLRLLAYIFRYYKIPFVFVVIAIVISATVGVIGNLFLRTLIDSYIVPFIGQESPDFGPLLRALLQMAAIYYTGVIATYTYSRIMINVSTGTLKRIRDDMFVHMESLPIRYFDTHAHGDIMSCYTNDTDTLRQMISQSMPQLISSAITLVTTFTSMVILSPLLTVLIVFMAFIMIQVTKKIGSKL